MLKHFSRLYHAYKYVFITFLKQSNHPFHYLLYNLFIGLPVTSLKHPGCIFELTRSLSKHLYNPHFQCLSVPHSRSSSYPAYPIPHTSPQSLQLPSLSIIHVQYNSHNPGLPDTRFKMANNFKKKEELSPLPTLPNIHALSL